MRRREKKIIKQNNTEHNHNHKQNQTKQNKTRHTDIENKHAMTIQEIKKQIVVKQRTKRVIILRWRNYYILKEA